MGNKHSTGEIAGQRAQDPTCRSFSWETEGQYKGGVQAMPNPNIARRGSFTVSPGHAPPLIGRPAPRAGSELGVNTLPPSQFMAASLQRDFARHRDYSMPRNINIQQTNEIVRNLPDKDIKNNNFVKGDSGLKENADKPGSPTSPESKKSRPGTSDSGYFGMDSDPKSRSRHMRGSRLSLNEAVFNQEPVMHMHGLPPMSMPSPFMMPPPPSNMMPPPPFNEKDAKKWFKKQKKLEKKHHKAGRGEAMMLPFPPPPGMPPFGGPLGGCNDWHRRSMDNLMHAGYVNTLPMGPGMRPPPGAQLYGSQNDLRFVGPPKWSGSQSVIGGAMPPPAVGIGPVKKVNSQKQSRGNSRTPSEAGAGSRRNTAPTHFEEERPSLQEVCSQNAHAGPCEAMTTEMSEAEKQDEQRLLQQDSGIYETLNGKTTVIAEIVVNDDSDEQEEETKNEDVQHGQEETQAEDDSESAATDLPIKVSSQAQTILDRNAAMFQSDQVDKEQLSQQPQQTTSKIEFPKKIEGMQKKVLEELNDNSQDGKLSPLSSLSSEDTEDTAGEPHLTATVNPLLPRQKHKKPKHFEPLDAWKDINVAEQVMLRQPDRDRPPVHTIADERLEVRLFAVAPSRTIESQEGEPIYNEYDDRLPDFKKRLIETGSFDIPESERRQSAHILPPQSDESKLVVEEPRMPMKTSPDQRDRVDLESLKRVDGDHSTVPQYLGNMHNAPSPKTNGRDHLTPNKANDSEIDFSWVDDLESKFRGEFAQYDQQREEVNQRSLRRGMDPSSIYNHYSNRADVQADRNGSPDHGPVHSTPIANGKPTATPALETSYNSAYHVQSNGAQQNPPTARYFGIYDSPTALNATYHVTAEPTQSSRDQELSQLDSQVRLKKAMFEQEAARSRQEAEVRRSNGQHNPPANIRSRSVSSYQQQRTNGYENHQHQHVERPLKQVEPRPYIPVPDYDGPPVSIPSPQVHLVYCPEIGGAAVRPSRRTPSQSPRISLSRSMERLPTSVNGGVGGWRYEQLSVDTRNAASPGRMPRHVPQDRLPVSVNRMADPSPRSPSERRIHRMEMTRQQENHQPHHNSYSNGVSRPAAYSNGGGSPAEMLQKGRKYDSTEYYRQNLLPEKRMNGSKPSPKHHHLNKNSSARAHHHREHQVHQYSSQPVMLNGGYSSNSNGYSNHHQSGPRPYQAQPGYRPVPFSSSRN